MRRLKQARLQAGAVATRGVRQLAAMLSMLSLQRAAVDAGELANPSLPGIHGGRVKEAIQQLQHVMQAAGLIRGGSRRITVTSH